MAERRQRRGLRCRACGAPIECCEFCEGEDCPEAACYGCVIVALEETLPHPHVHGG